jgi:hypothetical protein
VLIISDAVEKVKRAKNTVERIFSAPESARAEMRKV